MKIVGGRTERSMWDRFNRLQRTGNLLGAMNCWTRGGVFRFKTHEEYEEWKWQQRLKHHERQTKEIS